MSVFNPTQSVVRTVRLQRQPPYTLYLSYTLLFFLYVVQPVSARERNVTIDDQLGDRDTGERPRFTPDSEWATERCNACAIVPEIDQLFDRTARQATYRFERGFRLNSIDFTFNGTAIYIFFTLYNWEQSDLVTTSTECNFTLDGGSPTYFRHVGNPSLHNVRLYQRLVYQRTGLTPEPHHMNISVSGIDYNVFTSFDYAMYTVDVPDANPSITTSLISPSSSETGSSNNTNSDVSPGAIAGGVVGGLAALTVLAGLGYCYRRRHLKNLTSSNGSTTLPRPFTIDPTSPSHPLATSTDVAATTALLGSTGRTVLSNNPNEVPSSQTRREEPRIVLQSMHNNDATLVTLSGGRAQIPGSNILGSRDVENSIQAVNNRMSKLKEELGSRNDDTTVVSMGSSDHSGSRVTQELMGEVRRLRDEIQRLQMLQEYPEEVPPPMYTD